MNYGAIGGVIGHEITHGFDDQGRKSDGDGMLRDWWAAEDAAKFEAQATRLSCFAMSAVMSRNNFLRISIGSFSGSPSGYTTAATAGSSRRPPRIWK